ncbi:MAG: putative holin-like toxin [Peptococcaceae bacterium]
MNIESSHAVLRKQHGGEKDGLPCLRGGDNMVTFEALTCVFTFGLLVVAIIALRQK